MRQLDKERYRKKYFEIFDSNDQDFDKVIDAHEYCCDYPTLVKSQKWGCFECYSVFDAQKIMQEFNQNDFIICPCCDYDTIIGDASGYPVTDKKFLEKMQKFWMSPQS